MDIIEIVRTVIEDDNLPEMMKKTILLEMAKSLVVTYADFLSRTLDIPIEEVLAKIYNETDSMYEETDDERMLS